MYRILIVLIIYSLDFNNNIEIFRRSEILNFEAGTSKIKIVTEERMIGFQFFYTIYVESVVAHKAIVVL